MTDRILDDVGVDAGALPLLAHALLETWVRRQGRMLTLGGYLAAGGVRLMVAAREWQRQEQDPDLLLRGVPLAAGLEWRAGLGTEPVGEPLESFLADADAASHQRQQDDAKRTYRRRLVRRRTMAVLGSLTVLALAASALALVAFGRSRDDARRAADHLSRNLASLAGRQVLADPYLAAMLAVESLARLEPPLVEARDALVSARLALAGDRLIPYGDPFAVGDALAVAVDPAGEFAAVGNRDGSIALWDLSALRQTAVLTGPAGGVQEIAFSADGAWLAAASDDRSVWRWSLDGAQSSGYRLADLGSIVWSVAVTPDGESVAAATQVGGVWLLDAVTGQPQGDPVATGEFLAVAFSPDGRSLLAGDGDGG